MANKSYMELKIPKFEIKKYERIEDLLKELEKDYEMMYEKYISILKRMKKNDVFIIAVINMAEYYFDEDPDEFHRIEKIVNKKFRKKFKIGENFFILDFRELPLEYNALEKDLIVVKKINTIPFNFKMHLEEIKAFVSESCLDKSYDFEFEIIRGIL